jgi:hypothetical protein
MSDIIGSSPENEKSGSEEAQLKARACEFDEQLQKREAQFGPGHPSVAEILDQYAAFLRVNRLRPLDAANFTARARAIRGEAPQESITNGLRSKPRASARGKTVAAIFGGMVLLFVVSCAILVMNSANERRELAVDRQIGAQIHTPGASDIPSASSGPQLHPLNADSPGEAINVDTAITLTRTTVLYFHSDKCPYCRQMDPPVEQLSRRRPDLGFHTVYIDRPGSGDIDFESPAALQFDIHSVPQFRIYDARGAVAASGPQAKAQVKQWMLDAGVAR